MCDSTGKPLSIADVSESTSCKNKHQITLEKKSRRHVNKVSKTLNLMMTNLIFDIIFCKRKNVKKLKIKHADGM